VYSVSDERFTSKSAWTRHRQTHPVELKLHHACSECGWRFRRRSDLKNHLVNVHEGRRLKLEPEKIDNYKDKSCIGKGVVRSSEKQPVLPVSSITSESSNSVHIISHLFPQCDQGSCESNSRPNTHPCKQCGISFISNAFLVLHIQNVHLKSSMSKEAHSNLYRVYACKQCDFRCDTMRDLRRHAGMLHQHDRPFGCEQCGARFTQACDLYRHTRAVHLGERLYACKECDKQFTQAGNLSRHTKTVHLGERYACKQCKKLFTQAGNLFTHTKSVHQGERRYACKQCGVRCTNTRDFSRHIATVHTRE
jgi:uncharacterized Zn-finger protein